MNFDEAIKILLEQIDDRPEIIHIDVFIEPEEIDEGFPDGKGNYDEQTLEDWYDFAATIEGIIDNFGEVINISISKNPNSLSEYIDFYLYDEFGNKKNYLIDLRLSDHGQTSTAKTVRKNKVSKIDKKYILRSIVVNDKTYPSYSKATHALREIISKEMF